MKSIRYTNHAETAVRERGLDKRWIADTVVDPEWRTADPGHPEIERRYRAVAERQGRTLRVVCVETADEIRIISAFLDRKARRPQ